MIQFSRPFLDVPKMWQGLLLLSHYRVQMIFIYFPFGLSIIEGRVLLINVGILKVLSR